MATRWITLDVGLHPSVSCGGVDPVHHPALPVALRLPIRLACAPSPRQSTAISCRDDLAAHPGQDLDPSPPSHQARLGAQARDLSGNALAQLPQHRRCIQPLASRCQPWRNGRIERLFGTLQPLLRKLCPPTMHGLTHVLREFSRFYNEVRPHQSLAGLTPMEVWQGKSLSEAQQRHAHAHGKWVQVLDGLLVGYHTKC